MGRLNTVVPPKLYDFKYRITLNCINAALRPTYFTGSKRVALNISDEAFHLPASL